MSLPEFSSWFVWFIFRGSIQVCFHFWSHIFLYELSACESIWSDHEFRLISELNHIKSHRDFRAKPSIFEHYVLDSDWFGGMVRIRYYAGLMAGFFLLLLLCNLWGGGDRKVQCHILGSSILAEISRHLFCFTCSKVFCNLDRLLASCMSPTLVPCVRNLLLATIIAVFLHRW